MASPAFAQGDQNKTSDASGRITPSSPLARLPSLRRCPVSGTAWALAGIGLWHRYAAYTVLKQISGGPSQLVRTENVASGDMAVIKIVVVARFDSRPWTELVDSLFE